MQQPDDDLDDFAELDMGVSDPLTAFNKKKVKPKAAPKEPEKDDGLGFLRRANEERKQIDDDKQRM